MKRVMFPGSFDPITNGHLETVEQACQMFDEVDVVVMTNTRKKYLFTQNERVSFINKIFEKNSQVKVYAFPEKLTVDVAQKLKANIIIRGLRNSEDFIYEQKIATINQTLAPEIKTVFVMASPQNSFISSSMIKEVATFNGDIQKLVPDIVAKALQQKLGKSS